MKRRIDPSPDLLRLAGLQAGVLSTEQCIGLGLGRHSVSRLVDTHQWRRLDRGLVYLRDEEPPWEALAWAGVLLGGDRARIGGAGAGYLHGLLDAAPDHVPVLVPAQRVMTSRPPWTFERERPGVRSSKSLGGPPRPPVEDTVIDLCQNADAGQVVDLITKAIQSRLTTVVRLRRALGLRQRLRHRRLILDLLADVAEGAESALELGYLNNVERPHDLPQGSRQQNRHGTFGLRDVVYEEFELVVELDGRKGHEGMGRFRDMHRDNAATVAGETTLRYGWRDVMGRPCTVTQQVGYVLTARGWTGVVAACSRCRQVPRSV
jgi:hypothetical protein